jgi:hypothetical protein
LALVAIPGLVVTRIEIFTSQKERAAVPGTAALRGCCYFKLPA